MERTIWGPEKDYLTRQEVLDYLRISDTTLTRVMKKGLFPKPVAMGEETGRCWLWLDVIAYAHLRSRDSGLVTEKESEEDE